MNIKSLICLMFSFLLTSCSNEDSLPEPIVNHIVNDVAMSKGINFNTKKQVILNPFTGEEIEPCSKENASYSTQNKNKNSNCTIEIVELDPVIQYILDNAQSPKKVKVKKDGKIIDDDASAVVTIDVLYKGSHCEASFSGGVKTVNCSSLALDICNYYLKYRGRTGLKPKTQQIVNDCEVHFWR